MVSMELVGHGQNGASHGQNGASHGQNGASHGQNGASCGQHEASHGQNGTSHSQNGAGHSQNGASHGQNGAGHGLGVDECVDWFSAVSTASTAVLHPVGRCLASRPSGEEVTGVMWYSIPVCDGVLCCVMCGGIDCRVVLIIMKHLKNNFVSS